MMLMYTTVAPPSIRVTLQLDPIASALFILTLLLERLLNRVAGFSLSLDVVRVVLNSWPSLVRATGGILLGHHVITLPIAVELSVSIGCAGWKGRNPIEGTMTLYAVHDLFVRSSLESFLVRLRDCCDGGGLPGVISREEGRIVGPFVVIGTHAAGVEGVNGVRTHSMMFRDVSAAIGEGLFFRKLTQRGDCGVAWESFLEGRGATGSGTLVEVFFSMTGLVRGTLCARRA